MSDANNEDIDPDRRRFLGAAAMTIAASRLGALGATHTRLMEPRPETALTDQPPHPRVIRPAEAGRCRCAEHRIRRGRAGQRPAVILLHGWPYDIHSYVDVAPMLAAKGYRVIVPYLRGYGTTRFLSSDTFRNGQQSAVAHGCHRAHGRAQDREGDHRRLRLGRANGRHHGGALARALQGASSR